MKKLTIIITTVVCLFSGLTSRAQTSGNDVFIPIGKYITQGDVESLSAWFDNTMEVSVISSSHFSSRNQAKQIVKRFFDTYTPRSFRIDHTAGRTNMKYALGTLYAGGENFLVTIFVSRRDDTFHIQQLKIERMR